MVLELIEFYNMQCFKWSDLLNALFYFLWIEPSILSVGEKTAYLDFDQHLKIASKI